MSCDHSHSGEDGNLECPDYLNLITDYMENDLSSDKRALWEKHFSDCPPCREFFESFQSSLEMVEFLQANSCPTKVKERLEMILVDTAREKAAGKSD